MAQFSSIQSPTDSSNKYYLFLDECGDQNLTSFDPLFPVFTLCGVIMSQQQLFKEFEMGLKSDNLIGLQIADLIAYPITRHVLDENAVNLAFDIIKDNIYQSEGKLYGMKVFPNKKESPQ